MSAPLFGQIWRFGIVGVVATLTHVVISLIAHHRFGLSPIPSNFAGFATAWIVSYLGNYRWTFGGQSDHRRAMPRHIAIALVGLAASQVIVWVMTGPLALPFAWALGVVVVVVPALTFALSRGWAFRHRPADGPVS